MNDDSIATHMHCHVLSVLLTGPKKKKKKVTTQSELKKHLSPVAVSIMQFNSRAECCNWPIRIKHFRDLCNKIWLSCNCLLGNCILNSFLYIKSASLAVFHHNWHSFLQIRLLLLWLGYQIKRNLLRGAEFSRGKCKTYSPVPYTTEAPNGLPVDNEGWGRF